MLKPSVIESIIIRYLKKEISEEELRQLDTWLQESEEHRSLFFEYKQMHDMFILPNDKWDQNKNWQKLYKIISEKQSLPRQKRKSLLTFRLFKYASILLLIVGIGFGTGYYVSQKTLPDHSISNSYHEIIVEKGSRPNTIQLADGSKIIVNAASTVKYPVSFGIDRREIFLEGEAYFEVKHQSESPFVVHLPCQTITVLGTTFNIEAYKDEKYSTVTLIKGSIWMETTDENKRIVESFKVFPNQQIQVNNRMGTVNMVEVNGLVASAWTQGEYKFKNESLSSIMKRLEKYHDIEIHIEDESLKNMHFTGTFSMEQDIQEILEIINHEEVFKYKRIGKNYFITYRKRYNPLKTDCL